MPFNIPPPRKRARIRFLLVFCAATPLVASAKPQTAQDVQPATPSQPKLNLPAAEKSGLFAQLAKRDVTLSDDPAYNRKITLSGYSLDEVLKLHKGFKDASSGTVVVFIASDGYRATAPLKTLLNGKGVLATEIKGNNPSQKWENFKFGNRSITPAPFYLVWDGISYQNKAYPWPWGIIDIEFVSANSLYPMALPNSENNAALTGFDTFSNHCLPCHSINGDGGDLGPEFNYPKSVTEYWQESDFVAFAKNPKSYRISSAMYPKDYLTDAEFKSIWAYLRHMASRKAKPNDAK